MSPRKRVFSILITLAFSLLACNLFGSGEGGEEDGSIPDTDAGQQDQDTLDSADTNDHDRAAAGDQEASDGENVDEPQLPDILLNQLLESGAISLNGVQGNSDGETAGPVLTMSLTNPGTDEIVVDIPCGLVFAPSESDTQPMMVVQPLQVSLLAGETKEVTPFVICVDIAAAAPSTSSTYTIGYIAADDMLKFAECVCNEDLGIDPENALGVQFAAWTIQVQGDFSTLFSGEDTNALAEYYPGEDLEELAEMLQEMMAMYSQSWLDKCGIVIIPAE
jgi:hypothetical protein